MSEVTQALAKIKDFESVYNVLEGTFAGNDLNFSIRLVFNTLDSMLKTEFEKRNLTVSFVIDPSVPE